MKIVGRLHPRVRTIDATGDCDVSGGCYEIIVSKAGIKRALERHALEACLGRHEPSKAERVARM